MARLRDVPSVLRKCGLWIFLKRLYKEISEDNLMTWASALAYSWLFAIFPFFIFLLTLIPLLKYEWRIEAKRQIEFAVDQLPEDAGETVRSYIEPKLDQVLFQQKTGIRIIGLLITIWAASGGMAATMAGLDKCYDVPETRPIWVHRPLAIGLTILVGSLILVVIVLLPIGTVVTNRLTEGTERLLRMTPATRPTSQEVAATEPSDVSATAPIVAQRSATRPALLAGPVAKPRAFQLWLVLWQIARYGIALMLLLGIVALIFHFGPNIKQRWKFITPGSVFTVSVWLLLGVAFRIYVDRFGRYGEMYGAVGGVIILLFFFYLDALVLLVGAEINSEIDCIAREMTGKAEPATQELLDAAGVKPPETPPA
ncbi:MAG TPA: YihY/virulence factor BrkB family protein [Tepidisphaeraceae bacterium]|nr:YihY/virulence factor BrkB family protein [Tepidisphaeraceae bacterium]